MANKFIAKPVARLRYNYSDAQGSFITLYGTFSDERDPETGAYIDLDRRIHLIVQGEHNSYAGFVTSWHEDAIQFPAEADDILIVLAFESGELLGIATYQITQLEEKVFGYQQVLSLVSASIPIELECFAVSDAVMQQWQATAERKGE